MDNAAGDGDNVLDRTGNLCADDIVGVLEAIAPIVGSATVVSASPKVAQAVGYDLDSDLEEPGARHR